jgi:hypothetical protein
VTRGSLSEGSESLRLPPLQKHLEPSASIEAFIRGMNFLGKLHILRKTAPPLETGRASLDSKTVRKGSILAVEGDKGAMLDTVMAALEDSLRKTGEFDVKVIHGPILPRTRDGAPVSYKSFVDAVSEWHNRILEIVNFLKGTEPDIRRESIIHNPHRQLPRRQSETGSILSPISASVGGNDARMVLDNTESGLANESANDSNRRSDRRDSSISRISESSTSKHCNMSLYSTSSDDIPHYIPPTTPAIPLLIIPQYLLHASDSWAAALPVTGEYGVPDHWQWTATLWRGVPGPDFVLYVKVDTTEQHASGNSANAQSDGQWTGQRPSDGAWINSAVSVTGTAKATVELREDLGVLIVRQERGGLGQSAVRRVAFEVGEWVRAAAGRVR